MTPAQQNKLLAQEIGRRYAEFTQELYEDRADNARAFILRSASAMQNYRAVQEKTRRSKEAYRLALGFMYCCLLAASICAYIWVSHFTEVVNYLAMIAGNILLLATIILFFHPLMLCVILGSTLLWKAMR